MRRPRKSRFVKRTYRNHCGAANSRGTVATVGAYMLLITFAKVPWTPWHQLLHNQAAQSPRCPLLGSIEQASRLPGATCIANVGGVT